MAVPVPPPAGGAKRGRDGRAGPAQGGRDEACRREAGGGEARVVRQRGLVDVEHDRRLALVRRAALHAPVQLAAAHALELEGAVRGARSLGEAAVEVGLGGAAYRGEIALVAARVVVGAQRCRELAATPRSALADLR